MTKFRFSPDTTEKVSTALSKYKTTFGHGADYIDNWFTNIGLPIVSESLTSTFNGSLASGCFPGKIAPVALIFKSRSASKQGNYRPISVDNRIKTL